ncbi:hypothetical protein M433DRAFT_67217 [Acidomyces richmondensis BFW]|nr:MAG: hypothetical protein FE78DRAFT_148298 [Acidomyces sp. 'richmondensis']KYG45478.1 hypothetical protein M433DRAFT_67217 [Acidomyces richmondensis BFW]
MADAATAQPTINIPQIIAVALVGFFALRWLFHKPSSPTPSPSDARPAEQANIAHLAAIFPHLDPRYIAWDLHRNGQSVQATSERILSGRGLDTPPPSFRPQIPSTTPPSAPTDGAAKGAGDARHPDLISRYNLQGRVQGKGKEPVPSEEAMQRRSAWSGDKGVRAEGLRRRREEMVLAARRRMEEKIAEGG